MRLPPLEVLATWPAANYEHPSELRGNELLITTCIVFPIALFLVAIRMYTRICISGSFGIDDVLLLMAIPPAIGVATLLSLAVTRWGWDRHIWDVPTDEITLGLKVTSKLILSAIYLILTYSSGRGMPICSISFMLQDIITYFDKASYFKRHGIAQTFSYCCYCFCCFQMYRIYRCRNIYLHVSTQLHITNTLPMIYIGPSKTTGP